jgi:hypothetical protein
LLTHTVRIHPKKGRKKDRNKNIFQQITNIIKETNDSILSKSPGSIPTNT